MSAVKRDTDIYKKKDAEAKANRARREVQVGRGPAPDAVPEDVPEAEAQQPKRGRGRGRPASEQERVAFTTRVRADVRKKINISAATYDVKPSDVIDGLVDQFLDALDWEKVGANRH